MLYQQLLYHISLTSECQLLFKSIFKNMFYIFVFSQQQLNYHNKSLIICQQIISDNFIKISFVFSFSKKQEPMVRISSDDIAWRRPTLTGGNPQLQSALRSLTSVFDMGTGVSFSLSPPHYYLIE